MFGALPAFSNRRFSVIGKSAESLGFDFFVVGGSRETSRRPSRGEYQRAIDMSIASGIHSIAVRTVMSSGLEL